MQTPLRRLITAIQRFWRDIRKEKTSLRSVLLEGVFWRLLTIEIIILIWTLAYAWIAEEPGLRELLSRAIQLGILSTLVLAFIVITLGNFLDKKVIAPMEKIAEANRQLRDKEQTAMQVPISKHAPREIRDIVASRTHMLRSIFKVSEERLKMVGFLRETFGRYYSDKILDEILDPKEPVKLGGRHETLTLLMSDIRGFTTLSQSLPPEELMKLLNRYLGEMTSVILRYDGIIDEFIGDAILAFFGMNEAEKDHAARAAACAVEMQNALVKLTAEFEAEGYPPLEMGIGLNTGNVIVGNIGSKARMKFGIVGAAINATARIESNTVGGQILMGQSTYELIQTEAETEFQSTLHAKGMRDAIQIHSLVGLTGPRQLQLQRRTGPAASVEFAMPFHYWEVREKEIVGEAATGHVRWANSQTFRVDLESNPKALTNLRVRFTQPLRDHRFEDIYTKVVFESNDPDQQRPVLHITAMTPSDRAFMNQLLDSATQDTT